MFGLFGADPTEEEKQTAVKTLLERLSDGTQPVSDQLKQLAKEGDPKASDAAQKDPC